ncbi:hypothetical protein Tco_0933119, partial [Tanacetum coccineum]
YWLKEVDLSLLLKTGQPCLAKRSYNLCRVQEHMTLVSNLASFAKTCFFGRAGLMCLAGCVAATASGISKTAKNEAEKCDEAPREMKSDTDSTYYNDKAALLDVFKFIIESNKQHFNPNYVLKILNYGGNWTSKCCNKTSHLTLEPKGSCEKQSKSLEHMPDTMGRPDALQNLANALDQWADEYLRKANAYGWRVEGSVQRLENFDTSILFFRQCFREQRGLVT